MTPPAHHSKELDELIAALVDETITPEQSSRLQALLADDIDARRQFVRTMDLHASLFSYAAEDDAPPSGEAACSAVSPAQRWKARLIRAARHITRPTPFSFAVATVVIGLLITTMAYIGVPMIQSHNGAHLAEASRIVAKLSRFQDAHWASGQVGATVGSHLLAGHLLQLERGLAEVTFNDGAVIVVEGPARLVINDTDMAALRKGRLRAFVPTSAIGFKLTTPTMEIVDLGTEFGVGVDSQAATEVHVLKGSVAVSPIKDNAGQRHVVLGAGQSWKIDAPGSEGRAIASAPQRFALAIPDPHTLVLQAGRVNSATGGTYDGVEDVQLLQWAATNNFGARNDFDVGQSHGQRANALLRFDLTSLQGKVDRLVSVTLRLHPKTDAFYFPWKGEGTIELYRVRDSNAGWQQGSMAGAIDSGNWRGDPTWNHRRHADTPWAGSPGASKRGVDYDARPLASASYVPRTGYPLEFLLSGDLKFVRDWIDGKTNAGFLLREITGKPENRIAFHSSESTVFSARPQLIVVYVPAASKNSSPP